MFAGKQKYALFPLPISLPDVHGLGLKGSTGRVTGIPGKREVEVEVGTGRLIVFILVPFVPAEVPLPICHVG